MKHFTKNLEKQIKNDKIVKSLKFLVERYKNEIEQLKQSNTILIDFINLVFYN